MPVPSLLQPLRLGLGRRMAGGCPVNPDHDSMGMQFCSQSQIPYPPKTPNHPTSEEMARPQQTSTSQAKKVNCSGRTASGFGKRPVDYAHAGVPEVPGLLIEAANGKPGRLQCMLLSTGSHSSPALSSALPPLRSLLHIASIPSLSHHHLRTPSGQSLLL